MGWWAWRFFEGASPVLAPSGILAARTTVSPPRQAIPGHNVQYEFRRVLILGTVATGEQRMAELRDAIKEAHPVYYVADLARSVAFYTETLGLDQAWTFGEAIAGIRVLPGLLIVLCQDAEKIRSARTPALVFAVDDLDAVFASLTARGVSFTGPPEDRPYGRIATFHDPDGYCYDLCG